MTTAKQKNKQITQSGLLCWADGAWEDYLYWQLVDSKKLARINQLIRECLRDPFRGQGKPEPLKGSLTGYWSRRIDREHRLVYLPDGGNLYIAQCRFHT